MTRRHFRLAWLPLVVALPGCGDTIEAVMRDYYNVQHEIVDNMTKITDEESAKKYNEFYVSRLQPKENAVKERKDKIEKNLFQEADRKIHAMTIESMEAGILKGQISSLDTRVRIMQNRLRRIVVKLTEEKAEEIKRQKDQDFTVESAAIWPTLLNPTLPEKVTSKDQNQGGGGMPNPMNPMGDPGGQQPAPKAGLPAAANAALSFSIRCERDGNSWKESRQWKSGGQVIGKLEVNGVDLVPLTP